MKDIIEKEGDNIEMGYKSNAKFSKGDQVRVVRGDLMNARATVVEVNEADGIVKIRPKMKDFDQVVEVEPQDIVKEFKQGEHVKVIQGRHAGKTGTILTIDNTTVTVMTDNLNEIKCLANDLKISGERNVE